MVDHARITEVPNHLDEERRSHNRFHLGRSAKREALPQFAVGPLRDLATEKFGYTPEQSKNLNFTKDNNGKIYIQDGKRNFDSGIDQLKGADPKRHAELEYQIVKNAIVENFTVEKEDLNGLTIKNGVYSYYDREGDICCASRDDAGNKEEFDHIRQKIEGQITALGFKVDSISMPDNIKEELLKHAAEQEDPASKRAVKDGMIHNYRYSDGQLKLNIVPRDTTAAEDKLDRDMKEISIDPKALPSEVIKGLEYYATKQAVEDEYKLIDIYNVRIADGKIHVVANDGKTPYTFKADPSKMKNIKGILAKKGFNYNEQQISDSVRGAALQHAVDKETDQAKKDALKGATVYDYYTDDNGHVYHVLTKKKSPDGTEVRDGEMKRVAFTADEHNKLLDEAKLNAVKKYGELPDGTKITDDMVVAFHPNDKTKFVVTNHIDGDEYTFTENLNLSNGRELKDAIASELNVEPRVEPDILSKKSTDNTLISTRPSDKPERSLEKEMEDYGKNTIRILKVFEWFNRACRQAGQAVEGIGAAMAQFQDPSNLQQPPESGMEKTILDGVKKHVRLHKKMLQGRIEADVKAGILKREAADNMINSLDNHVERIHKEFKKSPLYSDQRKKEIFDEESDNSSSDSASLYSESDDS